MVHEALAPGHHHRHLLALHRPAHHGTGATGAHMHGSEPENASPELSPIRLRHDTSVTKVWLSRPRLAMNASGSTTSGYRGETSTAIGGPADDSSATAPYPVTVVVNNPCPTTRRAARGRSWHDRRSRWCGARIMLVITPAISLVHTADLDAHTRSAVRDLLDAAYGGGAFADTDWEHALGGMHVLSHDGDDVVGHAALVQRRLLHGGRALRTGYVEAVGVHPSHRRRGIATALMREVVRLVRGGYELGALAASEEAVALYAGLGWVRWTGPTAALTPDGITATPDEDSIMVLPVTAALDPAAELVCDWRDGDVW